MEQKNFVYGIRAVIEAIESGKDIDKILVRRDLTGELSRELMSKVKEYDIMVQRVPQEKLNRVTMKNHQGVIALLSPVTYQRLEHLVPLFYEEGKLPLLMILDGITDTRNFGAIARTCECAGVDAIVIPERNSVSVTPDAMKTSAGAFFYVPVCREKSIVAAVKYLHENGYNIVGATEKGAELYTKGNYTGPTAIIMGNEETGISEEVLRVCDDLAVIPVIGKIGSLNVSVAAGVMIYEAVRQRQIR